MSGIKVGVVEDEMIIADRICMALEQLGYIPTEPAISYTEALEMMEREKPDIMLLDIVLSGQKDGIDLAAKIKEDYDVPFIFLTANSDTATIERAKKVCPPAYLMKPFTKEELYSSIEICLHNYSALKLAKEPIQKDNYVIKDSLFIKQNNNFVKIRIDDIAILESDRVYVNVHTTKNKKMLVRSALHDYLDVINSTNFIRVHRSYAINVNHIDAINPELVTINGQEIPIGRAYKDDLFIALGLS
jgi:two-component system response regulator LytT